MSIGPLRHVITLVVLVLLGRAAVEAWRNRGLAGAIWRRVRPTHVAGTLALLTLVVVVASLLLAVPPLRLGLGTLVGFSGNAVFTPLEEVVTRSAPASTSTNGDWHVAALATAFLGFLVTLLPWLAFVEEETFRAGLEAADLRQELTAALRFGLMHLVMFVPIAAALAIALAGFVYGRIYRRAYRSHAYGEVPEVVARTYRPTPRARRAAIFAGLSGGAHTPALVGAGDGGATVETVADVAAERRQAAGVLASSVWHATFNSLVVMLLWLGVLLGAAT